MTIQKSQAIQTALIGDWNSAISLNLELLKESPNDIETLNRLAFAFVVTGNIKSAKSTYQKVLDLDSQNPIALKNLKRLVESDKKGNLNLTPKSFLSGQVDSMFIEESGKTKIVELVNVTTPKAITRLLTGEPLILRVKRLKIFVLDDKDQYIGVLPDDIGRRLIKFIKGGNIYDAYVKSIESHRVTIFIKETKRSAKFKNQPSFILTQKSELLLDKNINYDKPSKQKNSDFLKNNNNEDYLAEESEPDEEEV